MQTLPLIVVALLGLAVGSFLNVVIYRVPRDESLVRPGSHSPHCGHEVRNRHNVPVLGWLLLRGRCADCSAPISVRYPLVEAGTALLLAAVAVALGAIDLDVMRLPDKIVLPSYGVAVALLAPAVVAEHSWAAATRG